MSEGKTNIIITYGRATLTKLTIDWSPRIGLTGKA
jgi:hypothetical protein